MLHGDEYATRAPRERSALIVCRAETWLFIQQNIRQGCVDSTAATVAWSGNNAAWQNDVEISASSPPRATQL